jgi:hypothetical protein
VLELKRNGSGGGGAFHPFQKDESKTYLFGLLPIADAFIAWGHSAMDMKSSETSFTSFHIYSLVLILILSALLWFLFKPKKPSSEGSLHVPW